MTKVKVYICSHTHWDREWYGTFQDFRIRLCSLINKLIELFKSNKLKFFTLDGQTVVLEDYLEVYPEKRELIKKYTLSKKWVVGPWYTLPDEFLVSGESLIKNLLFGKKLGEKFGNWMKVGYLPDMFGHISQMPQILNGFGIKYAVIWRGVSKEKQYPFEVWWKSPDGSRVLTYRLPEAGYANLTFAVWSLPNEIRKKFLNKYQPEDIITDIKERIEILRSLVKYYKKYSLSGVLLLLNGVDHMQPDELISSTIEKANKKFENEKIEIKHSNLEEFFKELEHELRNQQLQPEIVEGIQRDTVFYAEQSSFVLPNVLSARIYLKSQNRRIENLIEHYANPADFFGELFLGKSFKNFIDVAYKWLLRNHSHDSIGGCSVDPVHRQMETRFEWAREIAEKVFENVFGSICEYKKVQASFQNNEFLFGVFNPSLIEREEVIQVDFPVPIEAFSKGFIPRSIEVSDINGKPVEAHFLGFSEKQPYYALWVSEKFAPLFECKKVRFLLRDQFPAFGFKFYKFKLKDHPSHNKNFISKDFGLMENEHLLIKINPNGTFTLIDKTNNVEIGPLNFFIDSGEKGDEYSYSPPYFDRIISTLTTNPEISIVENNFLRAIYRIRHRLLLPKKLSADKNSRSEETEEMTLDSYITLRKGCSFVEVKTETVNTVEDHILKIGFSINTAIEKNFAEQQFDIAEFPLRIEQPPSKFWLENQPTSYPLQRFCGIFGKGKGVVIFSKDLPEYWVNKDNGTIYLTLLRSVGHLTKKDLLTRKELGEKYSFSTPEAQMVGRKIVAEYAVGALSGDALPFDIFRKAEYFISPIKPFYSSKWIPIKTEAIRHIPDLTSLLKIEGNAVYSTLKRTEKKKNLFVLRLWNPYSKPQEVKVKFGFTPHSLFELTLSEEVRKTIKVSNTINLMLPPHFIYSLGIEI